MTIQGGPGEEQQGGSGCTAACRSRLRREWRRGLPWTLLAVGVTGLVAVIVAVSLGSSMMVRWGVASPFLLACGAPLVIKTARRLAGG